MSTLSPEGRPMSRPDPGPEVTGLDRVLRVFSVLTMLMTVPQVYAVWFGRDTGGVSLASWATYLVSACLWLVHGLRKKDKTIYVACFGWIALDAAIVAGVLMRG
jgi:uncharacterized protein with PQ loop repeat